MSIVSTFTRRRNGKHALAQRQRRLVFPFLFSLLLGLISTSALFAQAELFTIGTGTLSNDQYTYPCPYGHYYEGAKHEFLVLASELLDAGADAGTISALAFNIANLNGIEPLMGFTIKLKQTSATSLSSWDETGLTEVYSVSEYTCATGWNTHTFSSNFTWDGTSNILVYVCFNNNTDNSLSEYSYNASVNYTTTSFGSAIYYRSDNNDNVCNSGTSITTSSNRPNIRFSIAVTRYPNDAGIAAITEPTIPFTAGSKNVSVQLKNFGSNNLTSVSIPWSVNGTAQTPYSWTGSLQPGESTIVTLGTFNFSANTVYTVSAATTNPNSTTDSKTSNDSKSTTLRSGLSGAYTIGSAPSDFTTFSSAVAALNAYGVTGSVVFNVKSGTYNEQIAIAPIVGVNSMNTITFQAQSGSASSVTLTYAANSVNNNYVVQLNGVDYVTLKNLTIAATGTSYGYVVQLKSGADNNTITNCILNGSPTLTTSSNNAIIYSYSSGEANNNNTIISNNTMNNGSYGIYFYGTGSSDRGMGLRFVNNTMSSQYYRGMHLYYLEAPIVNNNALVVNTSYSSFYAMYIYYCLNGVSLQGNKIYGDKALYGIYLGSCYTTIVAPNIVANNFVHVGSSTFTSTVYGLYFTSSDYVNAYHNSVHAQGTSTSGRALYVSGGSVNALNNIFAHTGSGYAAYISSGLVSSNYNVFYTAGANLGYFNSSNRSNLAAWQSASGFDGNSIMTNPNFVSNTDLHTTNSAINGRGIGGTGITMDIDGAVRNAIAPDPGADEFTPTGRDAAITWLAPVRPAAAGNNTVSVKITNLRTTPITSVQLSYSDGSSTVTQAFSGISISPDGSQTLNFTTPYNLTGPVVLTGTILTVNGSADDDASNNTATSALRPALSGAYSVGTVASNYPTIDAALTALYAAGIVAPVTFNIASGTYNAQIILAPFAGGSATKTVTLQAASGNAADVVVQPSSTSSTDKHTVRFADGAEYYVLNKLTLMAPASGSYANVVEFGTNIKNTTVRNCVINALMYTTSSNFRGISVQNTGSYQEHILIENNIIRGGYYGVYFYGSPDYRANNIRLVNNSIEDFYLYGAYFYANANNTVAGNTVSRPTRTSLSTFYGVYLSSSNSGFTIERNRLHTIAPTVISSSVYAIYASGSDAAAGEENVVKNNLLYNLNSSGTVYAIYNYSSDGFRIYNNTIALNDSQNSSTGQTAGIVQAGSAINIDIKNNLVSITRGGTGFKLGILLNESTSIVSSDNNLFYVNGAGGNNFPGAYAGSAYYQLSDYQAASGQDAYSVVGDPMFAGAMDFHIAYNSPAAKFNGAVLPSVQSDIEGTTRSTRYGDIGAYASPATLYMVGNRDFGSIGKNATQRLEIQNTSGHSAISVSNLSFGGTDVSSYRVYQAGTRTPLPSSFTLAPNGSLAVDVDFGIQGVSGAGQRNASFTMLNNGALSPYTVAISGYYAALTAMDGATNLLTPGAKLDVGGILIGGTPRTKEFSLAPNAEKLALPIDISGYTITGTDAALFSVSTIPTSLNGQILVSITLSSLGATPGTKEAYLTINHTGANGPATVIRLEGKVGKPILGAPSLVDVPYVAVGQTYTSGFENVVLIPLTRSGLVDVDINQNPTLTGSGASAMEIVSYSGNYYIRGAYAGGGNPIVAGSGQLNDPVNWSSPSVTTPIKITDTQPWFVAVRMKQPSGNSIPGTYNAEILFSDGSGKGFSSAENAVITSVVGQIISDPSRLAFYPMQLAFGAVPVGTRQSKTLTLRNQSGTAGAATLLITGTDYSFGHGQKSLTIPMPADNSPVHVQVSFAPQVSGAANGVITANGVLTGTVPLSGTGQASNPSDLQILVNGEQLDGALNFGTVAIGQVATRTVTVVNNNVGPVTITAIGRSGANATQFGVGTASAMVIPGNGGSITFPVSFVPTSLSVPEKNAAISVYNNTGVPKIIAVRGVASLIGGNTVSVTLTPSSYNFGNQNGTYSFTVTNTGSAPITISGALILGSSNFTVVDNAATFPRTVNSGASTSIMVSFNATQGTNGLRSASFVVVTQNATPYPTSALSGMVGSGSFGSNGNAQVVTGYEHAHGNAVSVIGAYPNPFVQETELRYHLAAEMPVTVRLYDATGREVRTIELGVQKAGEHRLALQAGTMAVGTYYYTVETSTGRSSGVVTIVR